MPLIRIVRTTGRGLAVILAVLLVGSTPGFGEEAREAPDELAVDRALRHVQRTSLPLDQRLRAAALALEGAATADGESLMRAGLALLPDAPEPATWLLLAGREAAWLDARLQQVGSAQVRGLLDGAGEDDPRIATWAAAGLLFDVRPDGVAERLTSTWPPKGVVRAILRREGVDAETAAAARDEILDRLPAARALDAATSEDVEIMAQGLDALLALGDGALPVLLNEARRAAAGVPEGCVPRVTRAILALGLLGRKEALEPLVACLEASNGWVKVAAATALGDLGDPAACIALCHQILYRGDILRPLDQWDFPGEKETTVSAADWAGAAYYVVDGASADALLRLGVSGAVEWIIRNQLDPSKANMRVRVLQDGIDALRRAVPASPVGDFNPDAGIPQRRAAHARLLAWWKEHSFDGDLLARRIDENDEGFRREARRMIERLRGRSVMQLLISQETCGVLGPAVTPTLLETLAVAKKLFFRTEIVRALGVVRDLRAVPVLLEMMEDKASSMRHVAVTSAGAYLGRDDRVFPALLERLDDRDASPRVAALGALSTAPPSATMREALAAHTPEAHAREFGAEDRDYRMAWTVVDLVQRGEEVWPTVRDGLSHPERYIRTTWWELLRRALGLEKNVFDPITDPGADDWRTLDESLALEALRERRAP
jgi:HEAT repeat protein